MTVAKALVGTEYLIRIAGRQVKSQRERKLSARARLNGNFFGLSLFVVPGGRLFLGLMYLTYPDGFVKGIMPRIGCAYAGFACWDFGFAVLLFFLAGGQ